MRLATGPDPLEKIEITQSPWPLLRAGRERKEKVGNHEGGEGERGRRGTGGKGRKGREGREGGLSLSKVNFLVMSLARNNARCMQMRKTMHDLYREHQDVFRTPYGRVSQNDNRDKWRKYVYGVVNPRIEDG